MLTILVILIILWAIGLIGGYTFGGLLHLLLVVAVVVFLVDFIRGRQTTA